jgi:hypothetical protein
MVVSGDDDDDDDARRVHVAGRELHQQLDAAEAAEEQTRARWEEFPEHLRQDQVARSLSEDQGGGGGAASDDAAAAAATTAH